MLLPLLLLLLLLLLLACMTCLAAPNGYDPGARPLHHKHQN